MQGCAMSRRFRKFQAAMHDVLAQADKEKLHMTAVE